jgi:hypothetical protein
VSFESIHIQQQKRYLRIHKGKEKGKVISVIENHNMRAWEESRYSSTILDLGTRKWVVRFTHLSLYPQGKSRRYPLHRRLCGPQSRSGRWGPEKWIHTAVGNWTLAVQSVARRYTYWTVPAPTKKLMSKYINKRLIFTIIQNDNNSKNNNSLELILLWCWHSKVQNLKFRKHENLSGSLYGSTLPYYQNRFPWDSL